MKTLIRTALALFAVIALGFPTPTVAQIVSGPPAGAGSAPRLVPSGAVGFGSLGQPYTAVDLTHGLPVNCIVGCGGGGGGSNAAAASTGTTASGFASQTGYVGSDGKVYNWVGDLLGHPAVSIFGTVPISAASLPLPAGAAIAAKQPTLDTNGDIRLPTYTVTPFFVSIAASTSTTLLASSATRIGFDVQCATGGVGISRTGATLTSATPSSGGADLVIPASANAYFTPSYVSKTAAVTAYTGTAQACWGVSYAQQ
jgi:hypothetical protein